MSLGTLLHVTIIIFVIVYTLSCDWRDENQLSFQHGDIVRWIWSLLIESSHCWLLSDPFTFPFQSFWEELSFVCPYWPHGFVQEHYVSPRGYHELGTSNLFQSVSRLVNILVLWAPWFPSVAIKLCYCSVKASFKNTYALSMDTELCIFLITFLCHSTLQWYL